MDVGLCLISPLHVTAECWPGRRCPATLPHAATQATVGFKWLREATVRSNALCSQKSSWLRLESRKGSERSARGDVWMCVTGRGRATGMPACSFCSDAQLRHVGKEVFFSFGLKKQSYLCPFLQDKGLWKVPAIPKVENGSGYILLVYTTSDQCD